LSVVPQEELLPEIAVTDDAVPLPALLPPAEEHIADPVQLNPVVWFSLSLFFSLFLC